MIPNELQNFLTLSYGELEELNLAAKAQRQGRVPMHQIQEERLKYLTDEKRIKAVTVLFSDLEGRLHMLDYDKKFLVKSWDNLTFDGSSIRGFTAQRESDLRLHMDWSAFYWGPSDVFGAGKVLVFGEVIDKDGTPYSADIRGVLKGYAQSLYEKNGLHAERRQRNRRLPLQGHRRRTALSRDRQVRVREHRRILPLAARRPAAPFHRPLRGSAARHGLREREGPPGSGAVAVRNQLQLFGSGGGGRPDPALQADLPAGGHQHGADCVLPAQARGGRERQRHAHQRVGHEERQEHLLGSRRAKRR